MGRQFNVVMMPWNVPVAHGLHENVTVVVRMLGVSVVVSTREPEPKSDPDALSPLLPDALALFPDAAMSLL